MATQEQYYFGQGRLFSRPYGAEGAGGWRWWGDISELSISAESEKLEHKESYSGRRLPVRTIVTSTTMSLTGTLHQVDTEAIGELLYGTASEIPGGTVAGEDLGTVAVGDVLKLEYPGVSNLVITDSAGTPVTVGEENYILDARFGTLEFVGLPTPPLTMPLKASYEYAGGKQVPFFNRSQPILQLRYEGVNLAENDAPVIVEFYKVSSDPMQGWALIQNGQELAGNSFTLNPLADTIKPETGPLGRFGRFIQVASV
ncbi:MAG: hypothetical protein FWF20_11775 [Betaproteobacteria bacterium]|nr:hypothetical protein [Betaproteobacteria bacterium]MCL2887428.1 hypothetical protein [Betaproteobacteria bacterium]